MTVLVTGVAGFIGCDTALRLLDRGERVVGIDSVSGYYSTRLKQARLDRLEGRDGFTFHRIDLADRGALAAALDDAADIRRVVHLAAQPGVRHSIDHPFDYVDANLAGHVEVLEYCRHREGLQHLVYASSSSVYGDTSRRPFSVADRTGRPLSLYGATKLACEQMSHCYSHLYGLPQTGLRFFTVYGPWGRPDMAVYAFTDAIAAGRPIRVFNHGDMRRDFTFIDDIVTGVLAALDNPPPAEAPHRLYNIGNSRPEPLDRLIGLIETALGKKAEMIMEPMQPGEVGETHADIGETRRDLGFEPVTTLESGIPRFVEWYRSYHGT